MDQIQTGTTEPIKLDVRDSGGAGLTGATGVLARIHRASDDQFFDWTDLVFRSSGWTVRDIVCTEVDATLLPGVYEAPGGFPTGSVTGLSPDDTYLVYPINSGAPDTVGAVLPPPDELKVGHSADAIGRECVVSATIESTVPGTLKLLSWLIRANVPVTSGLTGATIELRNAAGSIIVSNAAMSGPDARGIFTREVAGVSLDDAANYTAIVAITDGVGVVTSYTAMPTLG
jgi:hypothetical protein